MTVLRRAMDASLVVRRTASVTQWLRQTRQRIAIGLGDAWSDRQEMREVERIRDLVSTSRIAAVLSALVTAPILASREARVRRLLDPLRRLELREQIRTASCAIVVAAFTHTALLALLGVPVHVLGWTMRMVLVAVGAIGLRWPEAFAAAWKDRQER